MLTYLAITRKYRPRWVVWENVPGVLSSNSGRDFGTFLGGLAECGYGFAYRVLDAQYFGLAQRRKRVFVVGHLGNWQRAAAVLFERASLSGHPAPRREAGQVAPTFTARRSGGGGFSGDFEYDGGLIAAEVAAALETTCHDYSRADGFNMIAHGLKAVGFDASEDGTGRGTPLVPMAMRESGQGYWMEDDIAGTLRAEGEDRPSRPSHVIGVPVAFDARQSDVIQYGDMTGPLDTHGHTMAVAIRTAQTSSNGHGIAEEVAYTLDQTQGQCVAFDTTQITSAANYSNPKPGDPCHPLAAGAHPPAVAHHMAVRRLTPRECERLQGFPDDYTLTPYRGKLAADGPRYKALGNSMAVPVMHWIGKRIESIDEYQRMQGRR